MTVQEVPKEGWGWPGLAKKSHYFVDGMSLCRRWLYMGMLEAETHKRSPDDCMPCRRKLDKRKGAA